MATKSTTSIKLEDDLKQRLNHLAEARQRSPHWLMKQAIGQYVQREERREQFKQDARDAWDDYQRTGLHLTGDEVEAWLEKIADGENVAMPEWHE